MEFFCYLPQISYNFPVESWLLKIVIGSDNGQAPSQQPAIAWNNINTGSRCLMASLGHSDLRLGVYVSY